jgi:hypothetical protein
MSRPRDSPPVGSVRIENDLKVARAARSRSPTPQAPVTWRRDRTQTAGDHRPERHAGHVRIRTGLDLGDDPVPVAGSVSQIVEEDRPADAAQTRENQALRRTPGFSPGQQRLEGGDLFIPAGQLGGRSPAPGEYGLATRFTFGRIPKDRAVYPLSIYLHRHWYPQRDRATSGRPAFHPRLKSQACRSHGLAGRVRQMPATFMRRPSPVKSSGLRV